MDKVSAWTEKVMIPTYEVGKAEKNPIFLEKRVYQGSRGSVYPHPVIEKIAQTKSEKEYNAVFIENKYLRIMVLPELGGRIQRAFDKIRNRDFVYYNQVIKPALVGLTGPWISGGIEFNWPQHHRPSTFDPIDYTIEEFPDGSKTIWVNEIEIMTRSKGMAGFTLYPDKAYLEIKGKIFNRTPFAQTFLWWANPAVKVNDHYQSVFPPDVYAVFDHGKRDVSDFPIATGSYYKVDYSPGTDISKYKNIPVPTSFMAVESSCDFIGGYENDTEAGMLHVADHHFSPGKKQWTWGAGDFGQAWDRNLTDEDGPYIELMCGVYTDNQPDFSWLQPNEEKTFEQYFLPYAGIGAVKNATKDAAVNLVIEGRSVTVKVYATAIFSNASVKLFAGEKLVEEWMVDLGPEKHFEGKYSVGDHNAVGVEVNTSGGRSLVKYRALLQEKKEIPAAASAAPPPRDVETVEKLFLHGLHLEQYRHATYDATSYYLEGLRRDPSDIRCNNAMGLWYLRNARPERSEKYFRAAIKSASLRNPNPYDGEPFYNLGLCQKMLGKNDEAYDLFYKSAWNDAWQHSSYLQLARLACIREDFDQALYLIDKSLMRNYSSSSVRHTRTSILRKLGRKEEAIEFAQASLKLDPFNAGCTFELDAMNAEIGEPPIRASFNNYAEYALDYSHAGMYIEALRLLEKIKVQDNPLLYYYRGWLHLQMGDHEEAVVNFKNASLAPSDYCFPSKAEEVMILRAAIRLNPSDAKAFYYLGNYWYSHYNAEEAIACWEESVRLDDRFPTALRNLSLAKYNKLKDIAGAVLAMERAFSLDKTDARVLMELDHLYKQLNHSHWKRLQLIEDNIAVAEGRNDLYLERITLYNQLGDFETADALISEKHFQPWEGGEGKVVAQFIICRVELAKIALRNGCGKQALALLDSLERYPENLGEGKLPNLPENNIHYWKAVVHREMGHADEARKFFSLAAQGDLRPSQAVFYNDAQPEHLFFKGKALAEIGETAKAQSIFNDLIAFGTDHMEDEVRIDYFAVSLPDLLVFDQDLNHKNKIHCHYLIALGFLGKNEKAAAGSHFAEVLKKDTNHQGAALFKADPFL